MVRSKVVKDHTKGPLEKGDSSRRHKHKSRRREEEEEIPNLLDPTPAPVLSFAHNQRLHALEYNRVLAPSRWIDVSTINELGIGNSVEFLTSRIGLWNFLSEVVPTYKNITIEFLSTVEFDRASGIISFDLGGFHFQRTCAEIMQLLNLPHDNPTTMNDTCTYDPAMSKHVFRTAICQTGVLSRQMTRAILHPTLRYIQRILAHTLFGRGETMAKFNEAETFYLYCMMRRSANEPHLLPHFGYFLCRHLHQVATEHRPNGQITVGGIITKLAHALHIDGADEIVLGHTTLNLEGLIQMRLVTRDATNTSWLSTGLQDHHYQLPLQEDIDPSNQSTWKLEGVPTVELAPPADHQAEPVAQAGASNQQLMNFMQEQLQQLNEGLDTRFASLATNFTSQFNTLNLRLDGMQTQINNAEDDAHYARWYGAQIYEANVAEEDREEPPTPPRVRRARQAAAAAARHNNPPNP